MSLITHREEICPEETLVALKQTMQFIFLFQTFTPTNNRSFVTSITSLGTCTCKIAIAHSDFFFSPLLILGKKQKEKNITEAELNKQKCTKPTDHKSGISADYPIT